MTQRIIVERMTTATATAESIPEPTAPPTATATATVAATAAALPQALIVRWNATASAVRTRVTAALARLRVALDLPSGTEVAALAARLDALDARLTALAEAEPADTGGDDDDRRRRGRSRRG